MEFPRLHLVEPASGASLAKLDPSRTPGLSGPGDQEKAAAAAIHAENLAQLPKLQSLLYAEGERSLLIVFQGMDASGKDGTIRNVFGSLHPQGVRVVGFRRPTPEEAAHDFLWRVHAETPARGHISVFNRSHYEDVLVPRVHGDLSRAECEARFRHINAFEELLTDSGTTLLKFFLHISRDEQKERLQARLDDPDKHWKFDEGDLDDRERWDEFMEAYEDAITACSTPRAPWYAIPADRKWYRDWAVSTIVRGVFEQLDPRPARPGFDPASVKID